MKKLYLLLAPFLLSIQAHSQLTTVMKNGVKVTVPDNPFDQFRLSTAASGQYLYVDNNGNVVGTTAPGSNLTSLKVAGLNYLSDAAYGGAGQFFLSAQFPCQLTQLTLETGGVFPRSNCVTIPYDNDYLPGWNYGNPASGTELGSYVHHTFGSASGVSSYSAGIKGVWSVPYFGTGPGDVSFFECATQLKQAWIVSADEGHHCYRNSIQELSPLLATVVSSTTTAAGSQITYTCTANCPNLGLNSPMIDLDSAQTGTVTAVANASVSQLQAVTISGFTVPVSTQGTLAAAIDVPRIIASTTGQLTISTPATISINTTVAATTSTLIGVMSLNNYEVIKPTSVGALSGGVQTITVAFRYSHPASTPICIGGAVGGYMEFTAYTIGSNRYLENVMCSTASNVEWVGHAAPNTLQTGAAAASGVSVGAIKQYLGAEVYGVLDATNTPSNGFAVVGPNAATWGTDHIENTNNISAHYDFSQNNSVINNPYAQRFHYVDGWFGLGGAKNSIANGLGIFTNINAASNYSGTGGSYDAPWGFVFQGAWASGITWDYWPTDSGGNIGFQPNCRGIAFCSRGPNPAATSQLQKIVGPDMNTQGSSIFSYNHVTQDWLFGSGGTGKGIFSNGVCVVSSAACFTVASGLFSSNVGIIVPTVVSANLIGPSGNLTESIAPDATNYPGSSLGIQLSQGGGVAGGLGQTAANLTATSDSTGYINPCSKYFVKNSTFKTEIFEHCSEGGYNTSGQVAQVGGHSYCIHDYFWDFLNAYTVEDYQVNCTAGVTSIGIKQIYVPTRVISNIESASQHGTLQTGILYSPFSLVSTAQTAAIGTQTLVTSPANSLWEVDSAGQCTAISSGATFTVTIGYTDTANVARGAAATGTCTTSGTSASVTSVVGMYQVKSGTSITLSTSISGTPTYDLRTVVRQLTAN